MIDHPPTTAAVTTQVAPETIHAPQSNREEAVSRSTDSEHHKSTRTAQKPAQQEQLTLSAEAEAVVKELQARDREVKAHEQAHMAAGAGLTGGATYSYQQGPDGQHYAVGGEVSIDTSVAAGDPETTIKNAETVRRAALAPSNPSAQDMAVAAAATQTITTAQAELANSESADKPLKAREAEAADSSSTAQPNSPEARNAQAEQQSIQRPVVEADQADTHINLFA